MFFFLSLFFLGRHIRELLDVKKKNTYKNVETPPAAEAQYHYVRVSPTFAFLIFMRAYIRTVRRLTEYNSAIVYGICHIYIYVYCMAYARDNIVTTAEAAGRVPMDVRSEIFSGR